MDEHTLKTLEFDKVRALLAAQTACSLGYERAEMLTPTSDSKQAELMQRETREALELLSKRGNIPLGGISDIRPHLHRASIGGVLDARDLLDIASTIESGRGLRVFLQKAGHDLIPTLIIYADRVGQFPELENAIRRSIAANGSVLDSASPELARVRSRKRTAEQRVNQRLNDYLSGGQRSMLQEAMIVQRGDRSCLAVKADFRGAFGGIVHDTSASGATLFIEPAAVVEIANEVREYEAAERREVIRILGDLTSRVAAKSGEITSTVNSLGTLDFIVARAKLAIEQNAVAPSWNSRGAVRLMSARHPLIDPERVVAIDVIVGEPSENQIVIITGPNTGGKTATLKTVGLLTLMAQSGLHIPASKADMNCYQSVFADIGDEQSIQQSLSTFSGHINTIARFISELTPNALVLLDEVGAGTDPGEGASLAQALLEHFRTQGARVVATSHYGELKTYAFTTDGVQNASVEFNEETLRPTYRVLQGIPGSSNALAIASKLGIPDSVIGQAGENLTGSDSSVEIMQELESARRHALADKAEAQKERHEARNVRARAENELSKFEKTRREIREQVLAEVRGVVRAAQSEVNDLLREIRQKQEQAHAESARKLLAEFEPAAERALDERLDLPHIPLRASSSDDDDLAPIRPLKSGDRVRVVSLGLVGKVLDTPDSKGRVAVQVGSLRLTVEPDALRLLTAQGKEVDVVRPVVKTRVVTVAHTEGNDTADSSLATMIATNISPQLELLGQRAEEAQMTLDRYIGDAHNAGLDRVRIVHGKGSGVLRRVVQEYLKANTQVKEYATADPQEGGAGATIAILHK